MSEPKLVYCPDCETVYFTHASFCKVQYCERLLVPLTLTINLNAASEIQVEAGSD